MLNKTSIIITDINTWKRLHCLHRNIDIFIGISKSFFFLLITFHLSLLRIVNATNVIIILYYTENHDVYK